MVEETSSSSRDDGKNLQWMYEGAKSMVNREDYLLGKKIDRNFEMFSDVIVHDKEEEKRDSFFHQSLLKPSTSAVSQHKVSALDTRVVRTEDPLVALKFQEEQRRRQLLENPLLKLKAQRVLRKAFEKELRKVKKKSKEKRRHSRSSSPSSSSPERRKEKRHHHSHRRERRKSGSEKEKERNRDSSNRRERAQSTSKRRTPDRIRGTESDRDQTKNTKHNNPPLTNKAQSNTTSPKKPTIEELEERRREMLGNANWRDKMRERNLSEAADQLKKEQDEVANNRSTGFTRPMMNVATEGSSIEKRLQSNRMNIQRQHDHMDKSFVRK